jgi:transposase
MPCRAGEGAVVPAPAPPRLVEGGLPTEALVAHVLVTKYADHVPLYRQSQIKGSPNLFMDETRAPVLDIRTLATE